MFALILTSELESYTTFEIANFVTDHPNILELITIIKESKKVSAEHSKMIVYQMKVENKDNKLLIEELKLLFLKCRAPNSHIFNAIITSMYPEFSNQLYKDEATKLRHACSLKMSDFRFKYLNKLTNMAKEYLKDNNSNTSVENFIGDSWHIILRMFLRAICKVEFEKSKADQESLRKFILELFKIVLDYEKGEVEGLDIPGNTIKNTLDHLTLDIKVPSTSKRNIHCNFTESFLRRASWTFQDTRGWFSESFKIERHTELSRQNGCKKTAPFSFIQNSENNFGRYL
ncbi:hypothetical protein C1646_776263 [Rhizophagus diaphanus]|nr:hypothetical protein C1646_776263 [Rhizophagus diaphanus] [Rhizophagus sp. MUCL 43196]